MKAVRKKLGVGNGYENTKAPVIGRGFAVVKNWDAVCETSLG
jgi:hypothetical protein